MSSAKNRLLELASAFENKNNSGKTAGPAPWKKFYQFWKMPDDTTATVRFLPDRDEESNPLKFLVENLTHDLVINGQKKKVPCLHMYGESCPICELSQKYYAEEGDNSPNGKKYYKKRSYIGQVIVIESPFDYIDPNDENPDIVKLIDFGPKVFKCINTAFKSGDLEEAPYEYRGGYNFRIKKTKAGQWSDYGTSSFSPKQTDLEDDLIIAAKEELHSLSEFREKYVSRATLEAMLLADQTGQAVSESSGNDKTEKADAGSADRAEASTSAQTTTDTDTPAPAASGKALSVLEQLKQRAAAKKAEAGE